MDVLRLMVDEAKAIVAAQREELTTVAGRATRVWQFNLLYVGVALPAVAAFTRAPPLAALVVVASGAALLLAGTLVAILSIGARKLFAGLAPPGMVAAAAAGTGPDAFLLETLRTYDLGIQENAVWVRSAKGRLRMALLATVAGTALVAVGIGAFLLFGEVK